MSVREFGYYFVILTKQGRLIDVRVRATSVSVALDRIIEINGLAGQVQDFRFTLVPLGEVPADTSNKVPNCS